MKFNKIICFAQAPAVTFLKNQKKPEYSHCRIRNKAARKYPFGRLLLFILYAFWGRMINIDIVFCYGCLPGLQPNYSTCLAFSSVNYIIIRRSEMLPPFYRIICSVIDNPGLSSYNVPGI